MKWSVEAEQNWMADYILYREQVDVQEQSEQLPLSPFPSPSSPFPFLFYYMIHVLFPTMYGFAGHAC